MFLDTAMEIYARVSNKNIGKIKRPLDSLFEKENGGGVKGCEEGKSRR